MAIPQVLDKIEIKGPIVTIDAMGTQTVIAAKIKERRVDYVLALKRNQGTLGGRKYALAVGCDISRRCKPYIGENSGSKSECNKKMVF